MIYFNRTVTVLVINIKRQCMIHQMLTPSLTASRHCALYIAKAEVKTLRPLFGIT